MAKQVFPSQAGEGVPQCLMVIVFGHLNETTLGVSCVPREAAEHRLGAALRPNHPSRFLATGLWPSIALSVKWEK